MDHILRGIIPPLVTPLRLDGSIDKEGIAKLAEYQIKAGIQSVFILGSCGEGSVLERDECAEMVKESVKVTADRVNLLVGVLEPSAERVVEAVRVYEQFGAERFVVPAPFYLSVSDQDEILRHYEYIADRVEGELIVYNIPDYVHTHILPETAEKLLGHSKIAGIKDSTGDWALFQKLLLEYQGRKGILSGNENLCGAAMLLGADGCVPCLANAYPGLYQKMYEAAKEKDIREVTEYQRVILKMKDIMAVGKHWIAAVKYMCARKGVIMPYVKGSACPLTAAETEKMDALLEEAGL